MALSQYESDEYTLYVSRTGHGLEMWSRGERVEDGRARRMLVRALAEMDAVAETYECRAPDGVCVNAARCEKHDKCCWESWEAVGA